MTDGQALRAVAALDFPDLSPGAVEGAPPVMRMVAPAELWVDESYQRGLSERSVRLIRKIVSEWSWAAFKPPVVVEVDGRLNVIDGQHTAIGAVTHGGIPAIPVMVIAAPKRETRASAFVRHNRDRISVTSTQLHAALVSAGDEDALTVDQVCARAGVKILKHPPSMARFAVGETLAVSVISGLVNRRHARGAREVLEVCVKAGAAPVSAALIRAVEHLLHSAEYKGEIDAERIAVVISAQMSTLFSEAQRFGHERKMPLWRALASVIYLNRKRVRHG
ncbi:hypothetical protein BJF92_12090 [Rhizobium rhizosphaerae]|uniref:Uncharacterized protein n=1 Tax=Xaviernesmea rhizosphaerae TaxID=1672749 RepID=A0A1Q9ANA6_9HYPH|nr:DUF6551 family protein [Xaviernesmea rhizosphaerae]OLP56805.1 hypothetical protein BJF92_12090 [Xaviernesmea rhizosphaerae]